MRRHVHAPGRSARYDEAERQFVNCFDVWQRWELAQVDVETLGRADVPAALRRRAEDDVDPPSSETGRYLRERVTEAGYRRLLEIASLDGLVEASQLSRTCRRRCTRCSRACSWRSPLAARYPDHAWELLLGYDQQRLMSARAGAAVARAAREADAFGADDWQARGEAA
jgi:hypothetical protein